jgi:hydrogenase expression/formation protein HypE
VNEGRTTEARLEVGKLPIDLLTRLLGELPPPPPELRLGPAVGEDACAIEVAGGILVVATDPITLLAEELGLLSVVVNANDVAVTGARPRWFLSVILVPPGTGDRAVSDLFATMNRALGLIGAHLVGGHTEITSAVTQPIVIGQMLGVAEAGVVVATGGVRPGDVVVQVGPAPIEGAAVLAREAAEQLGALDPLTLEAARAAVERPGISVVEPALLAARLGATALHDPTEGGLAAGLHELAHASGVRIRVDRGLSSGSSPGLPSVGRSAPTPGPPSRPEPFSPPSGHRSEQRASLTSDTRQPSSAAPKPERACTTPTANPSASEVRDRSWIDLAHAHDLVALRPREYDEGEAD